MTSTNTHMPPPACENCGRDKTATYICDACCDNLNAITRKRASDYEKLEAEVARLTTILYGKPIAAPEIPEVAAGPLMSVPQFFGMLNELRNSAQLHEATASAELAKDTTDDATRAAE